MTHYSFAPIQNESDLRERIVHIHTSCFTLCKHILGHHLPAAGNIGIFSHDEDEYQRLLDIQHTLTDKTKSVYGKYFLLHSPFVIPVQDDIPQATYTYLYIRKPDINKPHAGDVDFYMEPEQYTALKTSLLEGTIKPGMRVLDRTDLDLIELYEDNVSALAYIGMVRTPIIT